MKKLITIMTENNELKRYGLAGKFCDGDCVVENDKIYLFDNDEWFYVEFMKIEDNDNKKYVLPKTCFTEYKKTNKDDLQKLHN